MSFDTEAEARRFKAAKLKELAGRTVEEAVREHLTSMRERGLRESTIGRAERHLRRFFQLDRFDEEHGRVIPFGNPGGLLESLKPQRCEELYKALRADATVDTHRNELAAAKAFGDWCVEKNWLKDNPAKRVKPIGERNRGKPQLRIDETRKLVELCLELAEQEHVGAIAVLTALLLGLRASEVTDRVCRDLDDEGRLLWVPFGKTRRSKRALEVPELLSPYLLGLAEGRAPDAQLFGAGAVTYRRQPKRPRARDRYWVLAQVKTLCKRAGVPEVCAHSLRGLHATLATDAGATPHLVAQALGHGSIQVAEMHYTDRTAAHSARTRRVMGRLDTERLRTGMGVPVRALPAGAGNGDQ
ncbi:MAG: site-specific integrase [Myxococcales bacterium]|nr:site-specific integrase [Myxococcales bacterium]